MTTLRVPLAHGDADYLSQVRYAMSFASEEIATYDIDAQNVLVLDLKPGANEPVVMEKVNKLLERYADRRFGLKEVIHFKQERDLPVIDAWTLLQEQRWITPVGQGHVVLRGPAARLQQAIDAKAVAEVGGLFNAEPEIYPSTIKSETLDRVNHFTSFPEHVDFVTHLREDVEILAKFAKDCRDQKWKPEHHKDAMGTHDFAISPSCCYHCYESMEGWRMERPGRAVTALLDCHRYEAGNLTTMSRLRAFHMREVIWVGHPDFVRTSRVEAEKVLVKWAKEWEIDCTFENANDMFFTDDYSVKASFQRQQEAKRELRLRIPHENRNMSCASSNFHAATFGKAFDIQMDGRPVTSACMGWGLERWVYAIFSQLGLDLAKWPKAILADLDKYAPAPGNGVR